MFVWEATVVMLDGSVRYLMGILRYPDPHVALAEFDFLMNTNLMRVYLIYRGLCNYSYIAEVEAITFVQ